MDVEVKQRNRRRKRAQRMQAQRDSNKADHHDGDSGDEDVVPAKPPRPPNRRKKSKEPLCEEEIIDGFAILQFRSYEDLELVLKISTKQNIKRLTEIERPKIEPKAHITNHILVQHNHALTLTQDPAASDDSGRASERLTGSSVAPRDADSSRDRLSDASSRCSSGKGYICDSEGEDDKGSDDASSVIFASTPASRKREFPGALPPGLPSLAGGASGSPVPAPTPPDLPAPSPAPAQQPPHHPPQAIASAAAAVAASPTAAAAAVAIKAIQDSLPPPAPPPANMPSVPTASIPQPQPAAAAPVAHHHPPPALDPAHAMMPGGRAARTDSPAVATSANVPVAPSPGQYHHPSYAQHHQPLYAPYAAVTATAATTVAAVPPAHTAAATPYTTPVQAMSVTTVPPSPVNAATQLQPPHQPQSQQQPTAAAPATTVVNKLPAPSHISGGEREKQLVPPSTRGPSPVREVRESYSNISSLSRSSASTTAPSLPPPAITVAATTAVTPSSLSSGGNHGKHWGSSPATAQTSPAPQPRPTPPLHAGSFPGSAPIFGAPSMPPPAASRSSPMTGAPPNPNPFSAESLFQSSKYQTNQADMLRRELDNRFLASQDRSMGVAPPPYLRTEMHQHQHHHTHVHQHTTSLLPPPAASSLYPSPLSMSPMERLARRSQSSFKDIPKLGSVDSPFYRQNIGLPGTYPGYSPGLMHPGLTTGPTPFVPPNHLPTFQPKSVTPQDPTKPKIVKSGKWNAMHVRVAWEIYHHQQKSGEAKGGSIAAAAAAAAKPPTDLLRPPTHLFSPSVHGQRAPPHELQFGPSLAAAAAHRPPGYDQPPHHPGSLFASPSSNLGKSPFSAGSTLSPFTRYGAAPLGVSSGSPFSMNPFTRDGHLNLGPLHHDPWRTLQRTIPTFPPTVNPLPPTLPGLTPPGPAPWSIKPDPILEQREREAREREERERERLRREREERERREREEKQRRLEQQQQEQRERERREREKREMERRELERQRERERERLLQEQRLAESAKQMQPPIIRDRSPMRNGDMSEIRVKEEPRVKEEDIMARTDPRYHNPFLRHPGTLPPPPGPMLDRSRMLPHGLPPHPYHTAPAGHWGAPPTDPFYRYGYNPLMDAMRVQEERANFFSAYGAPHHPSQLRPKDPALMHLRTGPGPGPPPAAHKMSVTPPTDLHKKEEPR